MKTDRRKAEQRLTRKSKKNKSLNRESLEGKMSRIEEKEEEKIATINDEPYCPYS